MFAVLLTTLLAVSCPEPDIVFDLGGSGVHTFPIDTRTASDDHSLEGCDEVLDTSGADYVVAFEARSLGTSILGSVSADFDAIVYGLHQHDPENSPEGCLSSCRLVPAVDDTWEYSTEYHVDSPSGMFYIVVDGAAGESGTGELTIRVDVGVPTRETSWGEIKSVDREAD